MNTLTMASLSLAERALLLEALDCLLKHEHPEHEAHITQQETIQRLRLIGSLMNRLGRPVPTTALLSRSGV